LAPPETAVLFAALFDLLLKVELSVELAVPAEPATAVSLLLEPLVALFVVVALVPARVALEALALLALAFNAALAVEELVAAFVLLAVLDAVEPLMFDALLLADSVAFRLLLELALFMSELVLEDVSVFEELLEALWFSAPTRLSVESFETEFV
jgi:hypothetical protein